MSSSSFVFLCSGTTEAVSGFAESLVPLRVAFVTSLDYGELQVGLWPV